MARPKLTLIKGNSSAERRREDRFIVNDLLEGYIAKNTLRDFEVQLNDISESGLSFFVKNEKDCLAVNSNSEMSLFIRGSKSYFRCEITVVSVVKDSQNRFVHRVKIRDSSENAGALFYLSAFVQSVQMCRIENAS